MDQWIISSLQSLIKTVNEKMENYYLYEVIPPLIGFIDELTNWYVRTNRKRFWKEKDVDDIDKLNAFKTLHEVLLEFSKTMAPVLPFICEEIYQGLIQEKNSSIHLENYPEANDQIINKKLEEQIVIAKKIIKTGRNIRLNLNLPNKQPLEKISIISNNPQLVNDIESVREIILDELNLKNIDYLNEVDDWYKYECKPDFSKLGPKLGGEITNLSSFLNELKQNEIKEIIENNGLSYKKNKISLNDLDMRLVKLEERESHEIIEEFSINLDIQISDELFYERISREIVSIVQNQRKDLKFDITDRIKLKILTNDEKAKASFKLFNDYIAKETLATEINLVEKKASKVLLDFKLDTVIEKI